MEINEIDLNKLVEFIYRSIRDGRWLYWPPGPMTNQVFDRNACREQLRRYLESI